MEVKHKFRKKGLLYLGLNNLREKEISESWAV